MLFYYYCYNRPDDDYDGRSSTKGNGRNRPRPKRVTKKPQHYYDENGARDTDDPFCLIPVEEYTGVDPPFHVDVASNALVKFLLFLLINIIFIILFLFFIWFVN